MAFIVVYDANVLYPNVTRDLLIRIAQAGLVQAKWTDKILDETFTALSTKLPEVDGQKWERVRRLMQSAIRDGLVVGYEPLIDVVSGLPDPDETPRPSRAGSRPPRHRPHGAACSAQPGTPGWSAARPW